MQSIAALFVGNKPTDSKVNVGLVVYSTSLLVVKTIAVFIMLFPRVFFTELHAKGVGIRPQPCTF